MLRMKICIKAMDLEECITAVTDRVKRLTVLPERHRYRKTEQLS